MKRKSKSILAVLGYFLLGILIQGVVGAAGGVIITFWYLLKHGIQGLDSYDNLINQVMGSMMWILLFSSVITVLVLFIIYKCKKRNFKKEILLVRTESYNYFYGFLMAIGGLLINSGIITFIQRAGFMEDSFSAFTESTDMLIMGSTFMVFLVGCIVAPITEEILFRGVIYNTMIKTHEVKTVIITQAILFGLMHFNLIQFLYASFLGIIMGYVVYKTKSLCTAIIMHITNNTFAILLPVLLGKYESNTMINIILIVAGILLVSVTIKLVNKKNVKVDNHKDKIFIEVTDSDVLDIDDSNSRDENLEETDKES